MKKDRKKYQINYYDPDKWESIEEEKIREYAEGNFLNIDLFILSVQQNGEQPTKLTPFSFVRYV